MAKSAVLDGDLHVIGGEFAGFVGVRHEPLIGAFRSLGMNGHGNSLDLLKCAVNLRMRSFDGFAVSDTTAGLAFGHRHVLAAHLHGDRAAEAFRAERVFRPCDGLVVSWADDVKR